MITIVGLGPAGIERMSVGAHDVIMSAPTVFVRTARHPAVDELSAAGARFEPLDSVYEESGTFEEVYQRIAEIILGESQQSDVVYAVPGHPLVGESSVEVLIREARRHGIPYTVLGSESFIEASLEALEIGLDAGLKVLDALSMDAVTPSPDVGNLIYQVYDRSIASDVKLRLMEQYPDDFEVAIIRGAAPPGEIVLRVPLYRLDRCECDHLTSVYVPPVGENPQG